MKTKIIVIVGPTAVGKTALSIEVAKRFDGQIISGDSQQVYRGLDIGTAKIRPEEQEGIPHHLLDVREVGESYSAYDFVTEAAQAIREIAAQGQLPIIAVARGSISRACSRATIWVAPFLTRRFWLIGHSWIVGRMRLCLGK